MANKITQDIWKLLRSDLAVQKDLNRGLINVRALARHLIEKHGLEASLDSVISAIRRFEAKKFAEDERKLAKVLKNAKISTRNNIACFTLERGAASL